MLAKGGPLNSQYMYLLHAHRIYFETLITKTRDDIEDAQSYHGLKAM